MATWEIREGMTALSSDGHKLGKVIGREGDALVIEKGFFFPKDYLCRSSDVREVRGDEVVLGRTQEEFEGTFEHEGIWAEGGGKSPEREAALSSGTRQEVRVPVSEEQLEVQKRARQTGEVRVTKEVVTEHRHVDVPVTREKVRVERVPADRAMSANAKLGNDTVRVPITEEEVQVTKRPVVKEEVRISKQAETEHRDVDETVRKERARVDRGRGERDENIRPAYASDPDDPLKRR